MIKSLVVALCVFGAHLTALAQGPLAPSAAPAPSMRTLQQIEPRIPLETLPVTITQPGNYYLTKDWDFSAISNQYGITIAASDVTLDLGGHTLSLGNIGAIRVQDGVANAHISNGTLRNWSRYGIDAFGSIGLRVENVVVHDFGEVGILCGDHAVVRDCTVYNGVAGLRVGSNSQISRCTLFNLNAEDAVAISCSAAPGSVVSDVTIKNSSWAFLLVGCQVTNITAVDCIRGLLMESSTLDGATIANCSNVGVIAIASTIQRASVRSCPGPGFLLRSTSISKSTAIACESGFEVEDAVLRDCQAEGNTTYGFTVVLPGPEPEGETPKSSSFIGCMATDNGDSGFSVHNSTLKDCSARQNSKTGILATGSTLTHCMALENGKLGFQLENCTASELHSRANGEIGIACGTETRLTDSHSSGNQHSGVTALARCDLRDNSSGGNGLATNGVQYAEVYVEGSFNRIEGNHCTASTGSDDFGIQVKPGASGNTIIGNTVTSHAAQSYDIPTGNISGQIILNGAIPGTGIPASANFQL